MLRFVPLGVKGSSACCVFSLIFITLTGKVSWKQFLNEESRRRLLLNVWINIWDLIFDFAVYKLCRTLENSILHFVAGTSRVCFIFKYVFHNCVP